PSIELAANYTDLNFGDARREQDVYNVGFNIKIPLFSGFRDTYNVQRSRIVADQAENARDQLYSQTEVDVWQAYFDLQTSASSVASTANLVKSSNESAAAAAARYQAGMGSLLDLITAQLDQTNARALRIQSFLDWYTALARLNFSLGSSDVLSAAGKAR
ncbi:MAG TPA: TolC family protein, partial [Burkholderiales bacterium]|nr:TolC family protein [Burkholderiales bacterium]